MNNRRLRWMLGAMALVVVFITAYCNNFEARHPQSKLSSSPSSPFTESNIRYWADSINAILPALEKRQSLIYEKDNRSIHVTAYLDNGTPQLYIETASHNIDSTMEKLYYLKDGNLILYSEVKGLNNIMQKRDVVNMYYRNNTCFFADRTDASTNFKSKPIKINNADLDKSDNIKRLNDALDQRGKFNLVFQGITESPQSRYIILGRNDVDAYRAVVKVNREDEFIHELSTNTLRYTGSKLDLNYEINQDAEALYVSGKIDRR